MPNMDWKRLKPQQLGRYAEYYAKMEFASYGFDVYSSEVDDHGVDFVAKMNGRYYEVQVKALRENSTMYSFIKKSKMEDIHDLYRLVCLLIFFPDKLPEGYIIPATAWLTPNAVLVDRDYGKDGQTSKPEWGIQYSAKNKSLLDQYRISDYFHNINTETAKTEV